MVGASVIRERLYTVRARVFGDRLVYRPVAREILDLGLAPGSRVLDVGTGPGLLPRLITAGRPDLQVDAVDLSPDMITQARAQVRGVNFGVADVIELPFPDASFDLVVSTISQHQWADPVAGMREIRRVLAADGRALIYDWRASLDRAAQAATEAGLKATGRSPSRLVGGLVLTLPETNGSR